MAHRGGDLARTLAACDALAESAAFLVGHNLLAFDAPRLQAVQPGLRLLRLPRIDTLRLNPLAFPRNPYHHLVKDYQAGRLARPLRNDPERVAAAIGLPPHVMAVFGLCVGYPDPKRLSDIKPRLPQGTVLFHERYAPADEAAQISRYDSELSAFSKRQGMDSDTWTGRVIQRLSGTNGREAMRAARRRLGFELK